jgi:hypothetical protein
MIKMPEQEKEWSKGRGDSLAADLDILLGDLCIIWGFCNGLTGWELTHEGNAVTADHFAQAVISAEDLKPHDATAWLPKLRDVFVERYGETVSEAGFSPI